MMTKTINKDFDAVQYMRQVRNKISADIADLSVSQVLEYFKSRVPQQRILPSYS